ncbi:helix-turn-helix transcriptional regulator [Paenibacillus cellulosilyticus]|nr:helix-turn-helix transcriptional regulator [Paenibacillus cellulosilyticus]
MHYNLQKLADAASSEEQMELILTLFMDLFPVRNCYLFRYSPLGHIAEGIVYYDQHGLDHIRTIRDDVRSLPGIYSAIVELKAKYIPKRYFLKELGSKYIPSPTSTNSLLVIPICTGLVVTGYILSDEFDDGSIFNEEMLAILTRYGNLVGKCMEVTAKPAKHQGLSKRELEVMSKIANGDSIKEMVDTMSISEVTIKQYVKSVIKKLGAQNRTQAIAELVRKGIIF